MFFAMMIRSADDAWALSNMGRNARASPPRCATRRERLSFCLRDRGTREGSPVGTRETQATSRFPRVTETNHDALDKKFRQSTAPHCSYARCRGPFSQLRRIPACRVIFAARVPSHFRPRGVPTPHSYWPIGIEIPLSRNPEI